MCITPDLVLPVFPATSSSFSTISSDKLIIYLILNFLEIKLIRINRTNSFTINSKKYRTTWSNNNLVGRNEKINKLMRFRSNTIIFHKYLQSIGCFCLHHFYIILIDYVKGLTKLFLIL